MRSIRLAVTLATLLVLSVAHATPTPEQVCEGGRAQAAGKYTLCVQKSLAKLELVGDGLAYGVAAGKCVTKYAATWEKLQAKAAGSSETCDNPRFGTSVAGTVIDRLTGLPWEQKTTAVGSGENYADPHDVDNSYSWSTNGDGDVTDADGTAFTDFLASLNSDCFAGHCDWRLPMRDELLTIMTPAYPACSSMPCIDSSFGPTIGLTSNGRAYGSATTWARLPNQVWWGNFVNAPAAWVPKSEDYPFYVRAVRSSS